MYAVIKTGGKQYKVAANEKITIEKLKGEAGDQVEFGEVLMVANGGSIDLGAPLVKGATVVGEIAEHTRGPRIIIMKKRRRKHYRRRNGHRQDLTTVTITEILTGGAKPTAKAKSAKPAAAKPESLKAEAPKAATKAAAAAPAGKSDDISLIGGVGPKNEEILRKMGYNTFASIAAWSKADVERIGHEIKPAGRIEREEWVEQAKELAAGKPPRAKTDRDRA